jgi:hypothetical protein
MRRVGLLVAAAGAVVFIASLALLRYAGLRSGARRRPSRPGGSVIQWGKLGSAIGPGRNGPATCGREIVDRSDPYRRAQYAEEITNERGRAHSDLS